MARKVMSWKTRGMNRDLSVTAFNPEFAFENRNLRLGTNNGNTLMSWVNEKGTLALQLKTGDWYEANDNLATETSILGSPIGTAIINHQLVLFTTSIDDHEDYIYVLKYADEAKTKMLCRMLFGRNGYSLGFDVEHPLETLVSYESEKVQKVYWTDGINQPRVINIEGSIRANSATQFDFVPTLQLHEDVTVKKIFGAGGIFAPGVIQYAFTYYRKYGQESNIFYTTPLYYISHRERGASPEDRVDNAFVITVTGLDFSFDYLRIYSIQRTSINATPICKRVQDISLEGRDDETDTANYDKVVYTDTGTNGDSIDPTELLYKGGEWITAETMEQKDNTLFFGNIGYERMSIYNLANLNIKEDVLLSDSVRTFYPMQITKHSSATGNYLYSNQLTAYSDLGCTKSVPCGGFKWGDYYRCGVQFQYKTGKWSDPIWVGDYRIGGENFNVQKRSVVGGESSVVVSTIKGVLPGELISTIVSKGYKKLRPVVVFPDPQDRVTICQGIANPTLFTDTHRNKDNDIYAQSSWFYRPYVKSSDYMSNDNTGAIAPGLLKLGDNSYPELTYANRCIAPQEPDDDLLEVFDPANLRKVEIQGDFDTDNRFKIDSSVCTLNSPDVEFDESLKILDYAGTSAYNIGYSRITCTMSDIDIQTETPTVSSLGSGFVHKSFKTENAWGIVSGLFYDDTLVDDGVESDKSISKYPNMKESAKWMVYLWNKSGSLNNDINRPVDQGVASAVLKKKVISNLRYGTTNYYRGETELTYLGQTFPQIFSSNEVSIVKLGDDIYEGNVDTLLMPDHKDGMYFAFEGYKNLDNSGLFTYSMEWTTKKTDFTSNKWWKTFDDDPYSNASTEDKRCGFFIYDKNYNSTEYRWWLISLDNKESQIGEIYTDLVLKKEGVRMKYKSSPHIVFRVTSSVDASESDLNWTLPIVEIRKEVDVNSIFGGTSSDAFKANQWIPCGEPVSLIAGVDCEFVYSYGDSYYQRYDCLKTYPFTPEDPNQVVEIGSFMLETRVNIDGRYDSNRGQMNNLYMSPQNFNLLNPVYSQIDNFFTYRIMDEDVYTNIKYPNQVTWSKTKTSGADVDLWTNITLANTLEMDGDKGEISALQRFNDQLLCFQHTGIGQILYNENVAISATNGVPIEIANSEKVQGKRYISDTIGCDNKWTIVAGTMGLYFMDSNDRSIYIFNGKLNNISVAGGFNSWCKMYFPSSEVTWNPTYPSYNGKTAFISCFDKDNQEILFINENIALAYSEKYQVFTSFYDYNDVSFFCNLDDTGIWVKGNSLWKHQAGEYCNFFGNSRPYSTILIGNPEPQFSKIFTNLELRASVDTDGVDSSDTFTPYLPFDTLDTWNEYQYGIAYLRNMRSHAYMQHHTLDMLASLKRKFRIWRCDIPRDNSEVRDGVDTFDETFDETFHMLTRFRKHQQDRMRNPWLYLRLRKEAGESHRRTEIHDVMMTYFV